MATRAASQTIGPFFHEALRWKDGGNVQFASPGQRIVLEGRITDGAGEPVSDAMVETWQLPPQGVKQDDAPASGNPYGFARVQCAADGGFRIETSMPSGDAPCLNVTIFARGLLKGLRTRVYLAPRERVRADPLLKALADSPRLDTLIATPAGSAQYRWDVRLQGERETVFFAV